MQKETPVTTKLEAHKAILKIFLSQHFILVCYATMKIPVKQEYDGSFDP